LNEGGTGNDGAFIRDRYGAHTWLTATASSKVEPCL
jgi:hypothetical protein